MKIKEKQLFLYLQKFPADKLLPSTKIDIKETIVLWSVTWNHDSNYLSLKFQLIHYLWAAVSATSSPQDLIIWVIGLDNTTDIINMWGLHEKMILKNLNMNKKIYRNSFVIHKVPAKHKSLKLYFKL